MYTVLSISLNVFLAIRIGAERSDASNLMVPRKSLPTYTTHRYSNPKPLLQSHHVLGYPWQIVITELFLWNSKECLIATDYYSQSTH